MNRYREEGTTTSALDMMLQNHTSRYHVAAAAIRGAAKVNKAVEVDAHEMISYVMHLAQKDKDYIYANGAGTYISWSLLHSEFSADPSNQIPRVPSTLRNSSETRLRL